MLIIQSYLYFVNTLFFSINYSKTAPDSGYFTCLAGNISNQMLFKSLLFTFLLFFCVLSYDLSVTQYKKSYRCKKSANGFA